MKKIIILLLLIYATFESTGQVSILLPELYFGSDLQDVDMTQSWIGLFASNDKQHHLQSLDVTFQKVQHPMVDEEGERTGIQIITKAGNPNFIFSNPELFHPGDVKTCEIDKSTILPNETLVIQFLGKEYRLTAKGKMKTLSSGELVIEDYTLFISGDRCNNQLIGEATFFDDKMFEILWAGDLNDDREIDLILDLSYKYSFQEIVLFLSSDENASIVFQEMGRSRMYFD